MKLRVGDLTLDVTDDQAASLRRQLGVSAVTDSAPGLIDAATVAQRLGVNREYVYEHAEELGGQKIGNGPKAPWRFDPAKLCQIAASTTRPERQAQAPRSSKRRRKWSSGSGGLLEIKGESPYAQ